MTRRLVLNVAEKPSIAKLIALFLSDGNSSKGHSHSKYNPVYNFERDFRGQDADIIVTSVTGHIQGLQFPLKYKSWRNVDPSKLISEAKVERVFSEDKLPIVKNLKKFGKQATDLVLWLDCDREGEAICYEVIEACGLMDCKDTEIYRAHFSAATKSNIIKAYNNLKRPVKEMYYAVQVRQELDLRGGAAFTRLQTLAIQDGLDAPELKVVSYGSCQFPTLNFIVERDLKIKKFIPEKFWFLTCKVEGKDPSGKKVVVDLNWNQVKLFDKTAAMFIYSEMIDNSKDKATVLKVGKKEVKKYKPYPLNTVTFQKIATKNLRLSAHQIMSIAEKLYTKGFISYPRTETNKYEKSINLKKIITNLSKGSSQIADYANKILGGNGEHYLAPRPGKSDDKAHPPIHPVKIPTGLNNMEQRVYDLITTHFLAQNSRDAVGQETEVEVDFGGQLFSKKGILVKEQNFLEIYPYLKWRDSELPLFTEGEVLSPLEALLEEGSTSAPKPMTETELISLMEKNGIGTDATIHEHIKKIEDRKFIYKERLFLKSSNLGQGLIGSYKQMDLGEIYLPTLRRDLEIDLNAVAEGEKDPKKILEYYRSKLLSQFNKARSNQRVIIDELGKSYKRKNGYQSIKSMLIFLSGFTQISMILSQRIESIIK